MNQKRIIFLVCMVGVLSVLLFGCNPAHNSLRDKGSLKIMLSSGESQLAPQTVSQQISIAKYVVTLTKGSTVTTQEVAYTSNTQEVTFTNLLTGDWNIDVVAKDANNYSCYGGNATGTVFTTTNTVNVPLYLLNGNLDCTVILPQITGVNITSGIVKLINPVNGTSVDLNLSINGTTGLVDFGSVKAGTWYMEAEVFEDTTPLAWGSGILTVLPNRPNNALIEFTSVFESGDLIITVTMNESPADPTGLMVVWRNGAVTLNWNANPETNIAGYTVYRATSETGFKKILSYTLINGTTFTDTTAEEDQTYYYWVQAYNNDGYSSELSAFSTISTTQTAASTTLDLSMYSTVIYVDAVDGSDATGNGSLELPYKTVPKAASYVVNNTAVVIKSAGVYAIPNGLQSLLKTNMTVDYIVDYPVRGQVIFDLQLTQTNSSIKMTEYNSFIGVVLKQTSADTRMYEYFYDSSEPKLNMYNCVFEKRDNPNDPAPIFPMYMNNGTLNLGKNVYYYNCFFVPQFSHTDSDTSLSCNSFFTNCAFTNTEFTTDDYNLHEVNFDAATYQITSTGWQNAGTGTNTDGSQAHIGLYGGTHAWSL